MPAYAYPVKINKNRKRIEFTEIKQIEHNLTLDKLQLINVDGDSFDAEPWEIGNGYTITIYRSRAETIEERNSRVAGEISYMEEYNKRKSRADSRD